MNKHERDVRAGKHPPEAARSGKWRAVRAAYLKKHPRCFVCLTKKRVEIHHRRPFHTHPELELDPNNLITLCEGKDGGHHLLFGHLLNFKSVNVNVAEDAKAWRLKILTRPKLVTKKR